MEVQFLTSIAPIVRDSEASRSFYGDALGLNFEGQGGEYRYTHELQGAKHFGLGPFLRRPMHASETQYGLPRSPSRRPASSLRLLT